MNGPNTPAEGLPASATRRKFFKTVTYSAGVLLLTAAGISQYFYRRAKKTFSGKITGASFSLGHLIRNGDLKKAAYSTSVETLLVGGGIAGLSAAWWLKRNGYQNFRLLELEANVGGNSSSGKNDIGSYPLGAHYLPLPSQESKYVIFFLEEIGVISGYNEAGLPIYNEYHLCSDPHERLFFQGRWQEGMVPRKGISKDDKRQYREFFSFMELQKIAIGNDKKRAFVIPLNLSSQDPHYLKWDQISMAEFMKQSGFTSQFLNWYVNYCCRDDFGATIDNVSAWAGIHYFAARIGRAANTESQAVLVWPEGNGYLVNKMRENLSSHIKSNSLVFSIESKPDGVIVDYLDTVTNESIRLSAQKVIFAAPRFIGAHVIDALRSSRPSYLDHLTYAPWMVANLSLKNSPSGKGAALAWDNVSYYSKSLGYVVSTHQGLSLFPKKTVLTYYFALTDEDPATERRKALKRTHHEWANLVVDDLEKMHPGITNDIENIDISLWGHAMAIPRVGFISGNERKEMAKPVGHIHFAHSDMSGISIYEEAQYHGVEAAIKVLNELGHKSRTA